MIGSVVGNYKTTEKIGEGAMGAVFKGVDVMLDRAVTIKSLRPYRKHTMMIVLAAVAAGFFGGLLVTWLASPVSVSAQAMPRRIVAESVSAQSFVLVDRNNRTRGGLQLHQGGARLSLTDSRGRVRSAVIVGSDGRGSVVLFDQNGATGADLYLSSDGNPRLSMATAGKKSGALIYASPNGTACASLTGPAESVLWEAP